MQEQQKTDLNKVIEFLAAKFPESFSVKGPAKPLKVGIFNDIAEAISDEDPVSKTQIRHALRRYTNSWRYLEAVCNGSARVDLQGNDVEELTDEHKSHAQQQLDESKARFAEKKKAANKEKDKNSYKKSAKKVSNPPKRKPKSKSAEAKPAVEDKPLVAMEEFSAGSKVQVKLGASPIGAVIVESNKDEVSVQLNSGMVMKVKKENIFQA
jgi:ProP effector